MIDLSTTAIWAMLIWAKLYKELSLLAAVEAWVETEGYAVNVDDACAQNLAQCSSREDARFSMHMWRKTNRHAYCLGLPEL